MSQDSGRDYDTQSLTASVTDYPMENGRRYHKYHEGSYIYPNDEQELDRLDMQHHMLKLVNDGRLFFAPLQSPRRILDIGTGSGIWPIEMASVFPQSEIIGTDLSPVQPTEVPENVHFLVDDAIDDDWLWDADHFDMIHTAHLSGGFPSFKDLLRKIFKHLKPGGYAECHEFDTKPKCDDGTMPPDDPETFSTYPLQDWCELNTRSGQTADPPRQFRIAHRMARWMREVGFVDVQERVTKVPTNTWPSDPHQRNIGSWNETNWLEALSGWSYKSFTALGWSKPEIEVFLVDVRKAIQNHGQRRYESRVPGPLEARRRLARRRNTALAGIVGSGPLDGIECLFGRNGREHMKWSDSQSRKAPFDVRAAIATQAPFLDETDPPSEHDGPGSWSVVQEMTSKPSHDQTFDDLLGKCRTIDDARDLVRQLRIDIQRQPIYSRRIFCQLLSLAALGRSAIDEAAIFLEDPYLNTQGADNYLCAVQHIAAHQAVLGVPRTLLSTIDRALELGQISPPELHEIIKTLPEVFTTGSGEVESREPSLVDLYGQFWGAIGRCDVYGYADLSEEILDAWLETLLTDRSHKALLMAKDILLTTTAADVASPWVPLFITQWLKSSDGSRFRPKGDYANAILNKFTPETISTHIISITESLMTGERRDLLERWQHCLQRLRDIDTVVATTVWTNIKSSDGEPLRDSTEMPHRHQIIARVWALRTLSQNLPQRALWMQDPRATDKPISNLLHQYENILEKKLETGFLADFMESIQDLGIPYNGLLMLAVDLKTGKTLTSTTRQLLGELESSKVSFADTFTDLRAYNSMSSHFFSSYEKMAQNIDVTCPSFVQQAIHLARTGDAPSVWTLIRLLRCHTPLKIALAKSWQPIPDPSAKALVRYYPEARTAGCPDPHLTLEMIHVLAVSFSCSEKLTPRRSYELVRWLYAFLMKHNAPVKPAVVRALYHAGVVRFRRSGRRVARKRYDFIMQLVEEVEGPEVAETLKAPHQLGQFLPEKSF
ncbi:hypothetical protein FE257_009202 [Aspergillus nanangensis]|uniref:Methyltransferase domain-containing protein n=1 Tax=Aspergillus nanangensis TaxID=2582783 RepID=A0AAD4GT08_ASPNN|nr:hypothetical protein FE257_009202 [Aspergillus nanangensis]